MKNIKLIDALPTIFGLIAIVGAIAGSQLSEDYGYLPGTMLYAGGAFALVTSINSVGSAISKRKFGKIHILNVCWILLPSLFFAWGILVALTWNRFLGS